MKAPGVPRLELASSPDSEIPDSEAITVRTPNVPPLEPDQLGESTAPPVGRFAAPRPPTAGATQRLGALSASAAANVLPPSLRPWSMRPLSLRAPVSRQNEAAWFEREPRLVAPGVPEVGPDPIASPVSSRRGSPVARFALVTLALVALVTAGSIAFLGSGSRAVAGARPAEPVSTTRITNAEAPASTAPSTAPARPGAAATATPTTRDTDTATAKKSTAGGDPAAPAPRN